MAVSEIETAVSVPRIVGQHLPITVDNSPSHQESTNGPQTAFLGSMRDGGRRVESGENRPYLNASVGK